MTPWQTAIDALRVLQDFGVSDEKYDGYEAPTEATRQRALAWMEARAMTDPIRWPTRVNALDGGIRIEFCEGRQVRLQIEFENDGNDCWQEFRDGKVVATGQIALPVGEAGIAAADSLARSSGGF